MLEALYLGFLDVKTGPESSSRKRISTSLVDKDLDRVWGEENL